MDPLTQGALGAAASLALLAGRAPHSAAKLAWMGALGGMAPDLDVLIQSDTDPLLAIEYHRHFTHSLAFIPIGGAIAALPWLALASVRRSFWWVLLACTVGYATHGLLDACTTYGTLLFWPLSDARVSLSYISVIDPAFTLPLLGSVVAAARLGTPRLARLGLGWALFVMALGALQHQRALALQARVAAERGHAIERAAVFPTFMNTIAWRSLYQSGGRYHVDKLRVTFTGKACVTPGTSVPVLEPSADLAAQHAKSQRARRLFRWFSSDWVALDPEDPSVIGDLRYSFSPTEALPIWGVRVDDRSGKVEWVNNRSRRMPTFGDLIALVASDGHGHRCI